MVKGKRIFISGGAGFIGSRLVEQLVADNELVLFDNLARNALQGREAADHAHVTLIEGDVLDAAQLAEAMQGCQIVVHLAGVAGIDTVTQSPIKTMAVNYSGTDNALRAAAGLKACERFLNFSTSEVYGSDALDVSESEWTPIGPVGESRWSYAVGKLAAEHLAHAYFKEHGLPTVSLRPFNVYGPGQVGEGALHHFVKRAIASEPLTIFGDGSQVRAWTYVDDMVQAILLAMTAPAAVGRVFNIGHAKNSCTINDLAKLVVELAASSSAIEHQPKVGAEIELRRPNVTLAQQQLGFLAKTELRYGIKKTIEWYRANP